MSCFVHKLKETMKNVNVCNLDDDDSESVTRIDVVDVRFCKSLMCYFTFFMLLYAQFLHNSVPMVWFGLGTKNSWLWFGKDQVLVATNTTGRRCDVSLQNVKMPSRRDHPLHVPT